MCLSEASELCETKSESNWRHHIDWYMLTIYMMPVLWRSTTGPIVEAWHVLKLLRWRLWNDRRKRKRTSLQVDGSTKNIWRKRRNGPRNFDFSSFMHTTLRCAIVISMCYMIPVTKALWQLSEMIENSREWALRRGLVERNPVHGTEDCSIRISRSFEHSVSKSHETNQKVSFTTQDHSSSVFGIVWLLDPAHAALLTCYIYIYHGAVNS